MINFLEQQRASDATVQTKSIAKFGTTKKQRPNQPMEL